MAQTILVTGSTSGFGRLTVETLARQRYRVFAGMRAVAGKNASAAEELRALAQREQLALQIIEIDVTDDASVEQAIDAIARIRHRCWRHLRVCVRVAFPSNTCGGTYSCGNGVTKRQLSKKLCLRHTPKKSRRKSVSSPYGNGISAARWRTVSSADR